MVTGTLTILLSRRIKYTKQKLLKYVSLFAKCYKYPIVYISQFPFQFLAHCTEPVLSISCNVRLCLPPPPLHPPEIFNCVVWRILAKEHNPKVANQGEKFF